MLPCRSVLAGNLVAIAGVFLLVAPGQVLPAQACAPPPPPPSLIARQRREAVAREVAWAITPFANAERRTLLQRMAHYGVPGVSIAVIHEHQVEWVLSLGWADRDRRVPVTDTTRFLPGSISKSLNGVAVLDLAARGQLSLDDDVNRHLKHWRLPAAVIAKQRPVTVGALLSHTGGTGVRGFWGYHRGDVLPTITDILDGQPPATNEPVRVIALPGAEARYSGGGTMVTQQVVMDVTGRPYADHLARAVLGPLGMHCSTFEQPPPRHLEPLLATGYTTGGAPVRGRYPVMAEQAAAGLWTTAGDLARFILAVQRALRGVSTGPLTPWVARQMTTPAPGTTMGHGFFLVDTAGQRYFEHAAGNEGFSGEILGSLGGGRGVVVLQNGESAGLFQEIVRTVGRVYGWPGFASPAPRRDVPQPVPAVVLREAPGMYRDGETLLKIERRGSELWYQGGERAWRAIFLNDSTFVNEESQAEKRWRVDGRGQRWLVRSLGREARAARRLPDYALPLERALRYTGTFRDPRGNTFRLTLHRGAAPPSLLLEREGVSQPLLFLSPTECVMAGDLAIRYQVVIGARGPATALAADFGAGRELAYRIGS